MLVLWPNQAISGGMFSHQGIRFRIHSCCIFGSVKVMIFVSYHSDLDSGFFWQLAKHFDIVY